MKYTIIATCGAFILAFLFGKSRGKKSVEEKAQQRISKAETETDKANKKLYLMREASKIVNKEPVKETPKTKVDTLDELILAVGEMVRASQEEHK